MSTVTLKRGETITWDGKKVKVLPPCEIKNRGFWYCVTHRKNFHNNMEAYGHEYEPGTHRNVWVCLEHGPEEP